MKTIVMLLAVLVFCLTFFGGIYFFHADIFSSIENTVSFCVVNGVIGTLMFFAVKSTSK